MTPPWLRELVVVHKGVPVGTIRLPPVAAYKAADKEVAELLVSGIWSEDDGHGGPPELTFIPSIGYDLLRETIRNAGEAEDNDGFLGPASERGSEARAQAALVAAAQLCTELVLQDTEGRAAEYRVGWLAEHSVRSRPWFDVRLTKLTDDSATGAPLPPQQRRDANHEPPAA